MDHAELMPSRIFRLLKKISFESLEDATNRATLSESLLMAIDDQNSSNPVYHPSFSM